MDVTISIPATSINKNSTGLPQNIHLPMEYLNRLGLERGHPGSKSFPLYVRGEFKQRGTLQGETGNLSGIVPILRALDAYDRARKLVLRIEADNADDAGFRFIFDTPVVLTPEDHAPTADRAELDSRASRFMRAWDQRPGRPDPPKGSNAPSSRSTSRLEFNRSAAVIAWVLHRAAGKCELCSTPAPFKKTNGEPYLEVHHLVTLADGGPDTVENTAALCPNCHREFHSGAERVKRRQQLYKRIPALVPPP